MTNEALDIGTRVAYSDSANPYQTAIVVDEPTNMMGSQTCVFEDGHTAQVSLGAINGIGGWGYAAEPMATPEEIEDAKRRASLRQEKQRHEMRLARESQQANNEILKQAAPEWAKAVILATLVEDDCDGMTDYYATKDLKEVIIGWSKHTRNLFSEMRKAAKTSDIALVEVLGYGGEQIEHRENYSMGHGMYLKDGGCYDSGWEISKRNLDGLSLSHLDVSNLTPAEPTEEAQEQAPAACPVVAAMGAYLTEHKDDPDPMTQPELKGSRIGFDQWLWVVINPTPDSGLGDIRFKVDLNQLQNYLVGTAINKCERPSDRDMAVYTDESDAQADANERLARRSS